MLSVVMLRRVLSLWMVSVFAAALLAGIGGLALADEDGAAPDLVILYSGDGRGNINPAG